MKTPRKMRESSERCENQVKEMREANERDVKSN
jgi:hypothetical protein